MAIRREIVIILLLILFLAVAIKLMEIFSVNPGESADASKFVLEDLASKYPGADVSIMNITPETTNGSSYLQVEAKVTQDPLSPCPLLSHIYYDYPVQNFVPQ